MARWYAEARDKTYYMMNFCRQVSCQVLLNYFSLGAETVKTLQFVRRCLKACAAPSRCSGRGSPP